MLVMVGCAAPAPPTSTATHPVIPTFLPFSTAKIENYFGDTFCSWPCWQGISPGVTTSSEALQRLYDSPLVLKGSIQSKENKMGFGTADWSWTINGTLQGPVLAGDIEWRNGIVWQIALDGDHPAISLGEVINRFGTPEKVSFDLGDIPEDIVWDGVFFYVKSGFGLYMEWDMADPQITPSDHIKYVVLFKPTTIEDWISAIGLDIEVLNLQDWKGYGNLGDLYFR